MSSGLSMANVNKIKQMAERHEYNLAIDILDSQNLERSLNPQFLRSCAEIYENVGRHKEARQLYVKAHSMAPEGNKIIFSIMNFYLKLGYFDLAKRYFEEFESNDVTGGQQLKDAEYIIKKATGAEMGVLFDMLYPYYRDNLDEDWSFELFLVTYLMDKKEDYDIISSDYLATFKDGYYTQTIRDILAGSESAETYFYIYSKEEVPDKNPDEEEVRAFEKDVLKADYIRHNPDLQEAVITEMVDDGAGASKFFGGKRKNKSADSNDSGIELTEAEETAEVSEETPSETPTEDNGSSVEKGLKAFIKRKFGKGEKPEESDDKAADGKTDKETTDSEESKDKTESDETSEAENVESDNKESDTIKADSLFGAGEPSGEEVQNVSNAGSADFDSSLVRDEAEELGEKAEEAPAQSGPSKADMKEIKPEREFISYDFDDGFAPESESIMDLEEEEEEVFENPFDSISAYKEFERTKNEYRNTYSSSDSVIEPEPEEEYEDEYESEYEAEEALESESEYEEDANEYALPKIEAETSYDEEESFEAEYEEEEAFEPEDSYDEEESFEAETSYDEEESFEAETSYDEEETFEAETSYDEEESFEAETSYDEEETFEAESEYEEESYETESESYEPEVETETSYDEEESFEAESEYEEESYETESESYEPEVEAETSYDEEESFEADSEYESSSDEDEEPEEEAPAKSSYETYTDFMTKLNLYKSEYEAEYKSESSYKLDPSFELDTEFEEETSESEETEEISENKRLAEEADFIGEETVEADYGYEAEPEVAAEYEAEPEVEAELETEAEPVEESAVESEITEETVVEEAEQEPEVEGEAIAQPSEEEHEKTDMRSWLKSFFGFKDDDKKEEEPAEEVSAESDVHEPVVEETVEEEPQVEEPAAEEYQAETPVEESHVEEVKETSEEPVSEPKHEEPKKSYKLVNDNPYAGMFVGYRKSSFSSSFRSEPEIEEPVFEAPESKISFNVKSTENVIKNEEPVPEPIEEHYEEPVSEPVVESCEEPATEPVVESYEEPVSEPIVESYEEPVAEPVEEAYEEQVEESFEQPAHDNFDETDGESIIDTFDDYGVSNKSFDFPEFKTDLFPGLMKNEEVIENNFDEVASKQKEELDARLLEEEKKMREAEELLASLGIKI